MVNRESDNLNNVYYLLQAITAFMERIILKRLFVLLNSNNAPATNNTSVTPTPTPAPTPTPTPVTTPPSTSAKVDVSIDNMAFPSTTTVNKGQTVVWTNNDSTVHTVTFDDGSANSGTIAVGGTFSHTFNTAGSFTYHCNFHSNMTGKVVVQ